MKTPTLYFVTFRHLHFGTRLDAHTEAHNPQAAIARAARSVGLIARRRGFSWQFHHNDQGADRPQCYTLAELNPR